MFFYAYFFATPKAEEITTRKINRTTIIYDRTGNHKLYEIHSEENRKIIPHDQIPDAMRLATIIAEDVSFFEHQGLNIFSILRALKKNLESSEFQQGGSTITQQLARNVFLSRKKTLERKFLEIILAVKLERKFSKDEILDFYLNEIPYGSNAYGIEAASETFFGKKARELALDEAALLAALPKATTFYSPHGNNQEELLARQKMILKKIQSIDGADEEAIKQSLETDTLAKIMPFRAEIQAPHFVFYAKEFLEKEFGKEILETDGLKIYTTLDYDLQKKAEEAIRWGTERNTQHNATNAALVAIDPKNGEVLALVGSRNYFDKTINGQVNVALRPRQPGSSFKPFVYAKSFEKGYQPETLLYDIPINFGPDGSGKDYIPQNYNGNFRGLVSMRQALAMSLNVPAVETLYLSGINETVELTRRLGITTITDREQHGLSLALGSKEVKLLDMVSAFSVFANQGIRFDSKIIKKIIDQKGNVVREYNNEGREVLSKEVSAKINSVLSDNSARLAVFGGNTPLYFKKNTPIAAKTGTTQEFRDAWTIGYTPRIAAGVWAGNNDNHPMKPGSDGIFIAAPLWRNFLDRLPESFFSESFALYEKISSNKPLLTGKIPGKISYYKKESDDEISEEKAKKMDTDKIKTKFETENHSILYYVNKNDPLGSSPPDFSDPMLFRWEAALNRDFDDASLKKKR